MTATIRLSRVVDRGYHRRQNAHAAGYLRSLSRVRHGSREPRHVRDGLVPVLVQAAHLPHALIVLLSEPNQLARPRVRLPETAVYAFSQPSVAVRLSCARCRRLALERVVFPSESRSHSRSPRDQILDERRL